MATEETALTSVTADATPAAESDSSLASTSAGDSGVAAVASDALQQATTGAEAAVADPIGEILTGIPADDTDLQTVADEAHKTQLVQQRTQLRALGNAVRELQPLRDLQQFGAPDAIKPRLELAQKLYSPVLRNGQPVVDPVTQTPHITTTPFLQHLDKVSPGMPEQLFADAVNFRPMGENGQLDLPLGDQYLLFLKLDPSRLAEYRNIDALIARNSGTITAEELAEIPAEYHEAYRMLPPSIRAGWKSYDEADQTQILEQYKGQQAAAKRELDAAERDKAEKLRRDQEHAQAVHAAQRQYFDTVRRDRFTALYNSLAEQVTFSADAVTNSVQLGALCSTLALLLDPDWRFVAADTVLKPMGIKLPPGFDETLAKFDTNANAKVAYEKAGDIGQAGLAAADANDAANALMAKLQPLALKIAMKQGAAATEKAQQQAAQLAAAAAARPNVGAGAGGGATDSILPPGVLPGSREANDIIARRTGLFVETGA
jgi:hypothetical protein